MKVPPAAPANPATAPLTDPTGSDPMIAQANAARIQSVQKQTILDPLAKATQALQAVQQQISQVRTDPRTLSIGPSQFAASSPDARAQVLSGLLQKQAGLQQVVASLRQKIQNPSQGPMVAQTGSPAAPPAPAFSNAGGSTPFAATPTPNWWGTGQGPGDMPAGDPPYGQ